MSKDENQVGTGLYTAKEHLLISTKAIPTAQIDVVTNSRFFIRFTIIHIATYFRLCQTEKKII